MDDLPLPSVQLDLRVPAADPADSAERRRLEGVFSFFLALPLLSVGVDPPSSPNVSVTTPQASFPRQLRFGGRRLRDAEAKRVSGSGTGERHSTRKAINTQTGHTVECDQ